MGALVIPQKLGWVCGSLPKIFALFITKMAKIDPLLMTKMAEKPHTLWGRIYMYQYYPHMSKGLPLPPGCGVSLKYSRICEVKSKLISDATSNMPDTHACSVALTIVTYAADVCNGN